MKKYLYLAVLSCQLLSTFSQSVFWIESFGTGCNQGQVANGAAPTPTNGVWTVTSTGTNDPYAQEWYISATEAGMPLNTCGDGCLNNPSLTNRTLHVGNVAISSIGLSADQGATYLEGACGFGYCANTNKRAESPTINCTGYSNITLSFDYIQQGTPGSDYCELMYFDGTTWNSLGNISVTNNAVCSGQGGYWSNFTITLPSSANNNSNVKIGFRWQNVDDGVATDPSFAVDNIQLSAYTSTLNVVLTFSSSIVCVNDTVSATANTGTTTVTGYTWSSNPTGATFSPPTGSITSITFPFAGTYSINVSVTDGTNTASTTATINVLSGPFLSINVTNATAPGCSNGSATVNVIGTPPYTYTWMPNVSSTNVATNLNGTSGGTNYTVVVTDANGCNSSVTFSVGCITGISSLNNNPNGVIIIPNPNNGIFNIQHKLKGKVMFEIFDISGRKMQEFISESSNVPVNISELARGMYIIRMHNEAVKVEVPVIKE